MGEDGEVVFQRLAETDSGVDGNAGAGDPRRLARFDAPFQVVEYFQRRMVVGRGRLHGLGLPLAMHEDHTDAQIGGHGQRTMVSRQGRDVVDDGGPRRDRLFHHFGLAAVDRDHRPRSGGGQGLDHRKNAAAFLRRGHRIGPGPRGFTADIEDRHAGSGMLIPPCDGRLRGRVITAVGKAVGGDVEHAHDARLIEAESREGGPLIGQAREQAIDPRLVNPGEAGGPGREVVQASAPGDGVLTVARHHLDLVEPRPGAADPGGGPCHGDRPAKRA